MLDEFKELATQLNQLNKQAVLIYTPIVDSIIQSKCVNDNEIQFTLDYMLSFCSDSDMLLLYKKLCKYYYFINPEATVDYVNYYREMWDEESLEGDIDITPNESI